MTFRLRSALAATASAAMVVALSTVSPAAVAAATRAPSAAADGIQHSRPGSSLKGAPKVAFLVGRTIVTGSGARLRIGLPASHADHLLLLGHSGRGWVVVDTTGGSSNLYVVPSSHHTTRFWHVRGDFYQFLLAGNGTRVAQLAPDRLSAENTVVVFTTTGTVVASHRFKTGAADPDFTGLLAFSGSRLILSLNRTYDWTLTQAPVHLAEDYATTASIPLHVLFTGFGDSHEVVHEGPAPLSDPTHPTWTRKSEGAVTVSPNGDRVLFGTQDGRVQTYAMSNGALLGQSAAAGLVSGEAWESDTTYLISTFDNQGNVLQRCAYNGQQHAKCVTITSPTTQHLMLADS